MYVRTVYNYIRNYDNDGNSSLFFSHYPYVPSFLLKELIAGQGYSTYVGYNYTKDLFTNDSRYGERVPFKFADHREIDEDPISRLK